MDVASLFGHATILGTSHHFNVLAKALAAAKYTQVCFLP